MSAAFKPSSSKTLSVTSPFIPQILGEPALVAVTIDGTEAVDSLFSYQVILKTPASLRHLISDTANFNTAAWLGREMSVQIQLEGNGTVVAGQTGDSGLGNIGAGVREINGVVEAARFLKTEERHAYYEVSLKPWLFAATLVTDCRIYQDQTAPEIINDTLSGFNYPIEWRLIDAYPKRDYTTQFNESNFAFVSRLCETWGISYFFEHHDGKHRLIFTDNMSGYAPNSSAAYQTLLFHPSNAKIDEEYIHSFMPADKLASGVFTSKDFDYTRPRADLTVSREDPIQDAGHNRHEVYEWHSPYSGHQHYVQPMAGPGQAANTPLDEGSFMARIRMEQLRCQGCRAQGSGRLKGMQAGHSFQLKEHPRNAANIEYLILNTTLSIKEIAQATQNPDGQRHEVRLDFEAYPLRGAGGYRPPGKTPTPKMYGLESAIVVGPDNQTIWTDALGRVKVQFHWDRSGNNDQNSSCWLRVASPWAGNQLGAVHIPRIGQEALVAFISGNPDLPICSGRVHNQDNLPPWQLPDQQALSGFRSRELTAGGGNAAGGRSNHLVMDDSQGKIQAQLKSDHQHSQLSLGYITRVEGNQGRKDDRGQGFELRSDGHGSIRSGKGMVISTDARNQASSHIKDVQEALGNLSKARDQHQQYADYAQQLEAQDQHADQNDVAKALKAQNEDLKGQGEQGELTAPHLLLSSPAGIQSATPQSTHIASGEHTVLTSGGHVSFSIGKRFLVNARDGVRLLAHYAGMKLIAAAGVIEIKALTDAINLIAKLDISITSSTGKIRLYSPKAIEIGAGDSFTIWKPGSITDYSQTRTTFANFAAPGPRLMPGIAPELPHGEVCIECLFKAAKSGGIFMAAD
jgi:type VI secretion system secreted protein VgrG